MTLGFKDKEVRKLEGFQGYRCESGIREIILQHISKSRKKDCERN